MNNEPALLPIQTNNDVNNIIKEIKNIKEKTYKLSLNKDEYQLTMSINNPDKITFFATLNNKVILNYYESIYDFKEINDKSLLVNKKSIKDIFDFYDNLFQTNKITLKLSKQKDYMYLIFNNIVNNGEKKECKIELLRNKFDTDIILEKIIRENENIKGKQNIIKKQLDSYKDQISKLQKNTEEQKSKSQKKFEEQISDLQKKYEEQLLNLQKNSEEQKLELQTKMEEQILELQKKLEECNELNTNIINNYEQSINEMKKENRETIKLFEEKLRKLEEKLEKEIKNNKMIIPLNQEKKDQKGDIYKNNNIVGINRNQVYGTFDNLYDEEEDNKEKEEIPIIIKDEKKPINTINPDINIDNYYYNNNKKNQTRNIYMKKEKHNNINKNKVLEEKKENIFKNKTNNLIKFNTQKIIEEEQPKQYSYKIISENLEKDLNKEAELPKFKQIYFEFTIKNTGLNWPLNTKLMNDKDSDIKSDNINLRSLKTGESEKINIILYLDGIKPGNKKSIFHLNIEGKNYDESLTLNVNVKEHEKIIKLRELFHLSIEDFDSDKLFNALKKNKFDENKTFESLFN